jgi:predicted Zn finger-like uncharacterized protein
VKFLCDNCKAKYQIADEKVAGKTVRMKCRKCGHQIEVRAEVTETSVSGGAPRVDHGDKTIISAPPKRGQLATSLAGVKPRGAQHEQAPPTQTSGALSSAFKAAADASKHAKAGAGAEKGDPNDLLELSGREEWYAAINGVPVGPIRIAELRRKAAAGAVTEDSLVWQEGLEEWRPVKTITELARLVREAAASRHPSLTPVPSEPRIVTAPLPQAPQAPYAPQAPQAPVAPQQRPAARGVSAPRGQPLAPAALQSNVVPITRAHGAAVAKRLEIAPESEPYQEHTVALAPAPVVNPNLLAQGSPLGSPLGGPMGTPAPNPLLAPHGSPPGGQLPAPMFTPPPTQASMPPAGAPSPFASDAFAIPAAPSPQPSAALSATHAPMSAPAGLDRLDRADRVDLISIEPVVPKKGPPWWFILVAIFVGCFGLVASLAFFFPELGKKQEVIVERIIHAPTAKATEDVPPAPTAEATASATATAKAPLTGRATGPIAASTGHGAARLPDLGGASGPTVGGPTGPSPTPGSFDQRSIETVVNQRKAGVKRTCLDKGGNSTSQSTKITATLTIAPNGSVQNVSAAGDDPVAARCIENQLRNWSFPAPGEVKVVQIPFVFVRQG